MSSTDLTDRATEMGPSGAYLHTEHVSKSFGAIQALRDVNFDVGRGEVMGLVGENGAGKSTLVKILSGIYRPDGGSIILGGEIVDLSTSTKSERAGIAVMQQERSLVPTMSVAENIFLGQRQRAQIWRPRELARLATPYLEMVGLGAIDPYVSTGTLAAAERQLVELARMIARDAKLFILDEPTAALADAEIQRVKDAVVRLAESGRSVIYVTHRLGEIFELCDRVTVFRNGDCLPALPVSELTSETLIERMLGRPLAEMYPPRATNLGDVVLSVESLEARGLRVPVSFDTREGEILALAGQIGSGAGTVVRALAGEEAGVVARLRLGSGDVSLPSTPRAATVSGIAYCSNERKRDGLFAVRSIRENITAPALASVSPRGVISRRRELMRADYVCESFTIDVRRLRDRVSNLSGGNQQKVAVGKWLSIDPRLLLVEEPTVGVDVGARAEIYRNLRALAGKGLAIVFASSDIQEAIGLADTIITFHKGTPIRTRPASEASAREVLRDMTDPTAQPGRATSGPAPSGEAQSSHGTPESGP